MLVFAGQQLDCNMQEKSARVSRDRGLECRAMELTPAIGLPKVLLFDFGKSDHSRMAGVSFISLIVDHQEASSNVRVKASQCAEIT